jgi:hypothetical protein
MIWIEENEHTATRTAQIRRGPFSIEFGKNVDARQSKETYA